MALTKRYVKDGTDGKLIGSVTSGFSGQVEIAKDLHDQILGSSSGSRNVTRQGVSGAPISLNVADVGLVINTYDENKRFRSWLPENDCGFGTRIEKRTGKAVLESMRVTKKMRAEIEQRELHHKIATCLHEAAHAAVNLEFGNTVRWIVIGQGFGGGHVTPVRKGPKMTETPEGWVILAEDYIEYDRKVWMILGAGWMAEKRYMDQFASLGIAYGEAPQWSANLDLRDQRHLLTNPEDLRAETEQLIQKHWKFILCLAHALYDKGMNTPHPKWDWSTGKFKMTGKEIMAIWATCTAEVKP